MENHWLNRQTARSWRRLYPRIQREFAEYAKQNPAEWQSYNNRLHENFPRLFAVFIELYGKEYDFFYYLENLLIQTTQTWIDRSPALKSLDDQRLVDPHWFITHEALGGVCYVDLYAGSLRNLESKIPYFKELGLTYLHLMPLFRSPQRENDGGYAVSSYREVDPRLGTMEELMSLARALREAGISLALDFVFNHTSDEHPWAQKAIAGDEDLREYYYFFPDRTYPDVYDRTLREIFPEERPGSFSYHADTDNWIWTTFHSFQWDLNYKNPAVFNSMAAEMLFLANLGVEVLRLDALAFLWKEMGTSCENLPQAHLLIQAFNAVARVAAPATVFKSEAIVHPDEVVKYIHQDECQLSYNPLLMALLWESLATRKVELLKLALEERFELSEGTAWVNYVRSHDDIGWTFSDEDAARLGINGYDHRQFLNNFYTGEFPGSFARGIPFQENEVSGDARISGTTASLAGLEAAGDFQDGWEEELSVRRILLIHSVVLSLRGVPLIYLGDELGTLNDYSYRGVDSKSADSRWVHRPEFDPEQLAKRHDSDSSAGKIYSRLMALIRFRKETPLFSTGTLVVSSTSNPHVLGYLRLIEGEGLLFLANFSEAEQHIPIKELMAAGVDNSSLSSIRSSHGEDEQITLEGYRFLVVRCTPTVE